MKQLAAILVLAACGASGSSGGGGGDGNGGNTDAAPGDASGCQVVLAFDPQQPIADAQASVRGQARVYGALGVPTFSWTIIAPDSTAVTTMPEATDDSQIDFTAAQPGDYSVRAQVDDGTFCPDGFTMLHVAQTGAHYADYRVRVSPPAGAGAPPQETVIQVMGGADVTRTLALDPGVMVTGQVQNGATGVPAYLRFMPVASPNGFVEVYTDASGNYATRLLGQAHDVLVVPMVPGVAPARASWSLSTTSLAVSAGNAITGTLKDGSGAALAGAQVQLTSGGVPSTLATTAADGSFAVHTSLPVNSTFEVAVTPPAGRGLPSLAATGAFGATIAIQYANAPTCDLAATPVKRGAAFEPGALVTIVGALASGGGTIGGSPASAIVRMTATADSTGKLPSTLVPRAALSAVVDLGTGDLAVASIDTSACAAQTISAPAPATVAGTLIDAAGNHLAGGRIEAMPSGALALAGEPMIVAASIAGGAFSLPLASGGHYDVTFSDPHAHNASLAQTDVTAAGVPTTALLGKAIKLSGDISVIGNPNPVIGASIQILPLGAGPSAAPLAETASTETSTYAVGIPDPGTM